MKSMVLSMCALPAPVDAALRVLLSLDGESAKFKTEVEVGPTPDRMLPSQARRSKKHTADVDDVGALPHTHCPMSTRDALDNFLRAVHSSNFKEFEDDVVRRHQLYERAQKFEKTRDTRRREFLKGIGVDLT